MSNRRNNKSLCEKSMKMVKNIVKLSSFSIAKMTLGASAPLSPGAETGSVTVLTSPLRPQFPRGLRSQEPQSGSNTVSYLIEPFEGDGSSYLVQQETKSVDGQASDYIRKVHEKNRHASSEALQFSPYIMPPPPPVMM